MKAVIMAGGAGTRLRPLTCNIPKPMVSILDKPAMEYSIELLKEHGITDIIVTLQYLPNEITHYFGDGSEFGVHLSYYTEETPLGTAGSVKNAEQALTEPFLVISGDAVTDIDLKKAVAFHEEKGSIATLVLKKESKPLEYGVVVTDESGRITRFIEKPGWSEVFSDTVNTGIYILNPEVFSYYQENEFFDFSKDLFPILLNEQKPMFGYVADGYWCDIGDLEAYARCQFDILEGKVNAAIRAQEISPGIYLGQNVQVEKGAMLKPPVYIGDNTTVKNGATIGPYTVLGGDCLIMNYASAKKSVLLSGAHLGRCSELRGTIVGRHSILKDGVNAFEGAVIGDECTIHSQAKINPQIKIWPHKTVESATVLSDNLVWGSYHTRALFSDHYIAGEINVDITPEYTSKLGAAYGSMHKGEKIALADDGRLPSRMLKSSFIAGLASAGVEVVDLGAQIMPAVRFGIGFFGLSGGVYLRSGMSSFNITFFNKYGANLTRDTERKLENKFLRDDFGRCEPQDIREVSIYPGLETVFERQMIRMHAAGKYDGVSLMIDCAGEQGKQTLRRVFEELGCNVQFGNVYNKPPHTIGVMFDDSFDSMVLVDEDSRRVDDEKYRMLHTLLLLKNEMTQDLIVPISASHVTDEMAEAYKVNVTRTKTGEGDIQAVMNQKGENRQFMLSTNPLYFLTVLLDTMRRENLSLHDLLREIPSYYKATSFVDCNTEQKGEVIKKLIHKHQSDETELTEGIKIFMDKGWTLVVPDQDMPVFKIISEGFSEEYARELSEQCCLEINSLLKNGQHEK